MAEGGVMTSKTLQARKDRLARNKTERNKRIEGKNRVARNAERDKRIERPDERPGHLQDAPGRQ
jgi:hypothetical protein